MSKNNLVIVSTVFAGIFVNAIITTLLGPSIVKIMSEFSVDFSLAGAILSFWSLGAMTSIFTGKLADKYGPFNVVRLGFLIMGIMSVLMSLSNSIFLLYLLSFISGIATGFVESSINQIILELYPNSQGTMITILHAFFGFGATFGPSIATFLIYKANSWRIGYLLFGSLLFLVAISQFSVKVRQKNETMSSISSKNNFDYSLLLLLSFGIFLELIVELGTNSWLPTFLSKTNRTSYIEAGVVLSIFWGAFSLSRLMSGKIADKYGFEKTLAIFSFVGMLAGVMALFTSGFILNAVIWALIGFSIAPTYPIIMAIAYQKFTSSAGATIGKIVFLGYISTLLIAPVFGTIDNLFGSIYATLLIPLSSLGLTILFLKLKKIDERNILA